MSLYEFGYNPYSFRDYSWGDDEYDPWGDDSDDDYEDITFYRPDGTTEGKTIQWCLDNGFYEIEEGLWSGDWYYRHFPDAKKKKKVKQRNNTSSRVGYPHPYRHHKKLQGPCACPVDGCSYTFVSDEKVQDHLKQCNGKAHRRYRQEHGIISYNVQFQEWKAQAISDLQRSMSRLQNSSNWKRASPCSSMDNTHSLSDMSVTYRKKKESQKTIEGSPSSSVDSTHSLSDIPVIYRKKKESQKKIEGSPSSSMGSTHSLSDMPVVYRKKKESQKAIDIRSYVGGQASPLSSSNNEEEAPPPRKCKGQTDIRSFFQPKSVSP